jgi:magnesium transporter
MWIDIVDPTMEEIRWLEQQFSLHTSVVSDLLRVDRRPALLAYTDYIFLSLFQPEMHLNQVEAHEVHCIVAEHVFITVRHAGATSVDGAYERVVNNEQYWERGVLYFLYLTAQAVIDAYYPLVDRISHHLNELEEQLLVEKPKRSTERHVYRLKQQLINLRQMVAPQRQVLANAIGEERFTRSDESRDLFRHLYERLLQVYDIIDSQRDLSSNVLDLIQSQASARLGDAMSRLTIFSMIFLPLTFIIGLFELNFITTEPELRIPIPGLLVFVAIVLVMALIASVMIWFFRKQEWI